MNFNELALPRTLRDSLARMDFQTMTPIQEQAIPVALDRRDLIGLSQTGTGKTAAFSIPIVARLIAEPETSALILVPTRELANQIAEVMKDLTRHNPELRILSLIGGMSMQPQLRQIQKGYRIVVATPGRLLDHLQRRKSILSHASIVVLDEADRMLDMGFAPQLRQIFPALPAQRQTLLFSATFPKEIEMMAQKLMKKPVKIQAGAISVPVTNINQRAVRMSGSQKNERLLDEINTRAGSMLIFVRTQRRVDRVAKFLKSYGLDVTSLHGGKSQGQRNRAIQGFRDESFRILCATDIVARGLDISHVAHVVNYDLPQVPEDYVHRIGRTARNGRDGESISFIGSEEIELWRGIEKLLKQKNAIPKVEVMAEKAGDAPARAPMKTPGKPAARPAAKEAKSAARTVAREAKPARPASREATPTANTRPSSRPAQKPMKIRFKQNPSAGSFIRAK